MRYFLLFILVTFSVYGDNTVSTTTVQAIGLAAVEKSCARLKKDSWSEMVLGEGGAEVAQKVESSEKEKCQALLALREAGKFGRLPFVPIKTNTPVTQSLQNNQQSSTASSQNAAQIGCVGSEYAIDYHACEKLVKSINAMGTAEVLIDISQTEKLKSKQGEIYQGASEVQGDTKAILQAQLAELRVRMAQNNKKKIFYGAEVANLTRSMLKWPKSKNLEKNLVKLAKDDSAYDGFVQLAKSHGRELIPNEGLRYSLSGLIQQSGLKLQQLVTNHEDMKRQEADLLARLGIADETLAGTSEFLTTYCQSPEGLADAEKCGAFGVNPNYNTTGLANFGDDQEWSAANIGSNGINGVAGEFNPNDSATGEGQDSIRDGLLDFENEKSSGGFIDNPNAATITEGGGAGAGGGGAGGGAGGGGGGAPALSTKPNQPGEKELASLTKVKSDGTYGKTKGSFYKKARVGKKTRRSDDDDGSRKGLSELGLDFPKSAEDAPVGPQNIALFDLISDRYEKVTEQGRVKQ